MALIGYARVSTDEQTVRSQLDELRAAGCILIHEEHASGGSRARPVLAQVLRQMQAGDVLVVVRLDRLARSLKRSGGHYQPAGRQCGRCGPAGPLPPESLRATR